MSDVIDVDPGRTIIEQGEEGNGFYVLKSGTLEVIKDNMVLTLLMYPGTIFGEMGDILGIPHTCTVRAKSKSKIMFFSSEVMEESFSQTPDLVLRFLRTIASRLDRTTKKLAATIKD